MQIIMYVLVLQQHTAVLIPLSGFGKKMMSRRIPPPQHSTPTLMEHLRRKKLMYQLARSLLSALLCFHSPSWCRNCKFISTLIVWIEKKSVLKSTLCTTPSPSFLEIMNSYHSWWFWCILSHLFSCYGSWSRSASEVGPTIKKYFEGFNTFLSEFFF